MASTNGLKVAVFLSSVRPNRMADRVCTYLKNCLTKKGMTPVILDPLEIQFEIIQLPIHFMPNPDEAPEWLKDVHQKILTADAFLIVSGEYNSTIPPALTNMMNHFPPASYNYRPAGIITYSIGQFGGFRAALTLRSYLAEFGIFPVPTSVTLAMVQKKFSEDGELDDTDAARVIDRQLNQLAWTANAMKNQKTIEAIPS